MRTSTKAENVEDSVGLELRLGLQRTLKIWYPTEHSLSLEYATYIQEVVNPTRAMMNTVASEIDPVNLPFREVTMQPYLKPDTIIT